jgi:fumarylpyruvate hydrolase
METGRPITPIGATGPIVAGKIAVTVNGEPRQSSDVSLLIWSVAEVISDLSHFVELTPGDVIYTGTPDGVGPVQRGNTMVGTIDGLQDLTIAVAAA